MYTVFETRMSNITTYFALTDEQMNDDRRRVLFKETTKEFAKVQTVREMKALPTERKIVYINKRGQIKLA